MNRCNCPNCATDNCPAAEPNPPQPPPTKVDEATLGAVIRWLKRRIAGDSCDNEIINNIVIDAQSVESLRAAVEANEKEN